jgi:uncharacterized membrane protein
MPVVTTIVCSKAERATVWRELLDSESFPQYMEHVQAVRIEDGATDFRRISDWSVLLKGSELQWRELELIDHDKCRIDFEQVEGDLAYFTGYWHVRDAEDGATEVELYVSFDIGIPLLADMLNPVAARALEENSRHMLQRLDERISL